MLLQSLYDSGFTAFDEVVFVMSQSDIDQSPRKIDLTDIFPDLPNTQICFIQMKFNNFDYSGYQALHLYHDDPLVADDSYLYVHDTSTFDSDFLNKYRSLNPVSGSIITCNQIGRAHV